MRHFRFSVLFGSLALMLMLSACGSVPQPFRYSQAEGSLMPDLAGGVVVRPVTGQTDDPYSLAEAMVRVLNVAEVPAILKEETPTEDKKPRVPLPDKTVIIGGNVQDAKTIVWQVCTADGQELGEYRQTLIKPLSQGMTPDALRGVTQRALPGVLALLPIDKTVHMAGPARIKLLPVTEAPGDGPIRLTSSMRLALKNAGFIITDEQPSYILSGYVLLSPYQQGSDMVTVTWLLTYPDGVELARIQQANPVPSGMLDGPWGDLATLIAEGGVQGVQEALRQ